LPRYEEAGIEAAYWQIAHEPSIVPLPDMPTYDVVFLGNVIDEKRRKMLEMLRELPDVNVGIYGDWEHADGHNTYNFAEGESLYRNATIAIADNVYPDTQSYISNRPIQAMAAGGAVLLHQHVPGMFDLSGWVAGVHYIEWNNFDDLRVSIDYWLKDGQLASRKAITQTAKAHVEVHHSYDRRVEELFGELLPQAEKA